MIILYIALGLVLGYILIVFVLPLLGAGLVISFENRKDIGIFLLKAGILIYIIYAIVSSIDDIKEDPTGALVFLGIVVLLFIWATIKEKWDKSKIDKVATFNIIKSVFILTVFVVGLVVLFKWSGRHSQTNPTESSVVNTIQSDSNSLRTYTTSSGIHIEIIKEGIGEQAKRGDTVIINSVLVENNQKSSLYPITTIIGSGPLPNAWDESIIGMRVGEKRAIGIPVSAYDNQDFRAQFKVGTILYYEVELVSIKQ